MVLTMVLYELSRCLFSGVSSKGVVRRAFFFFLTAIHQRATCWLSQRNTSLISACGKEKKRKGGGGYQGITVCKSFKKSQ